MKIFKLLELIVFTFWIFIQMCLNDFISIEII